MQKVTNTKVYNLLKNKNANKALGCDLIPLKLVNIAEDQLAEPLACIISSAIIQDISSVTPTYIGGSDKRTFSNYRPVSVLITFSKITEL